MTDITRAFRTGAGLGSIGDNAQRVVSGNKCLVTCGLAIHGSNAENVLTANAIDFAIDGVIYELAAQTEIDLSAEPVLDADGDTVTATALATAKDRIYLLVVDKSGNIGIVEGEAKDTGESVYAPGCPDDWCPFGAIKVANASGSNFTLGTTDLSASGVTDTYFDLMSVPAGAL